MQRLDLAAPIGYNGRYGNGIWGGISVTKQTVLNQLYRGIIVSCQALPGEPLHGRGMMAAMAQAAKEGGAVGIRANGVEDIAAIRRQVALPVIGIVKAEYPGSPVYITPTEAEVEALLQAGAEIIALDATARPRPQGLAHRRHAGAVSLRCRSGRRLVCVPPAHGALLKKAGENFTFALFQLLEYAAFAEIPFSRPSRPVSVLIASCGASTATQMMLIPFSR